MSTITLAAALLALSLGSVSSGGEDPLDSAKSLYLSASYQEALSALADLPAGTDLDQADKYRALCYLGLNRTQDAETAIEQLLTRRPLYSVDPLESPKLVAMVREARIRTLPTAAKTGYAAAKGAFEKGDLPAASSQFAALLELLSQPEAAAVPSLADLKMLAEGFEKLTDQQRAAERAAAPAEPRPSTPAPSPTIAPAGAISAAIFSIDDAGVVPPVQLVQAIPRWIPPNTGVRAQSFSGTLEIVVDEHGSVMAARMLQPVNGLYDQLLLSAAKQWRYRPAMRDGQPVRYRKTIPVVLKPATGADGQP